MKPKYAIVRVDDNMFCPAHFEKINNDFVCNYKAKCYDGYGQQLKNPLGCEKCKYGDTKEQLIQKIHQELTRQVYKNNFKLKDIATKIVEFLGVTE